MASILPSKKRKQPQTGESTGKKKKKKEKCTESGTLTLDDVKALGHQLLFSRAHINNLPVLLCFISPSAPFDCALESLVSLQSFFVPLLPEIPSYSSAVRASAGAAQDDAEEDAELVFKVWLGESFDEFIDKLIEIAVCEESIDAFRDVSLDAIMDFVKLGKGGKFHSAIYHRFLQRIVRATSAAYPLLDLLGPKYFKYTDVRYFTYTSMDKIIKNFESKIMSELGNGNLNDDDCNDQVLSNASRVDSAVRMIYNLLSRFPSLESEKEQLNEMWSPLGLFSRESEADSSRDLVLDANDAVSFKNHIIKKIKLKFTKVWISFLKLPLPLDVYKEVLASLHQNVIPYMTNPSVLCDFLTRSYDIGGVISVMALSGLYVLMTKCGLDYPNFYERLYALLTPSVFMAKHRAMFFQLLDTCLKSPYIPAYLAAAFAKKLSRLALLVPPAGALVIIAVIHNLLRRHPSINFLVHQSLEDENDRDALGDENDRDALRDENEGDASELVVTAVCSRKIGVDPFDIQESDPALSNAMRSSLWEIETLRHHYTPAVSRFVASLENDLTVRAKTSEVSVADFSSGSYATIFKDEIRNWVILHNCYHRIPDPLLRSPVGTVLRSLSGNSSLGKVRRRIKQVPLAFYRVLPTTLFSQSEFPGWNFDNQEIDNQLQ